MHGGRGPAWLAGGSMNAPQNFPAQFDSWAMPLSPQDIEHRLKLFNPDGDFERRLAKTWELAGDIIAPVTERFWNSIKQHPRSLIRSNDAEFVRIMTDLEIQKYTAPIDARWVEQDRKSTRLNSSH